MPPQEIHPPETRQTLIPVNSKETSPWQLAVNLQHVLPIIAAELGSHRPTA
jgi:hypothetical protein